MAILLCDRMRVSWRELAQTPAAVIDAYLIVMSAESDAQKTQERWEKRDKAT
jgi:hypothetical protein|tara:strand:+ start:209 stop:364 length:156 start_codon:yes stop_codon:yes gene_type:complete